jgi:hypothetical protein
MTSMLPALVVWIDFRKVFLVLLLLVTASVTSRAVWALDGDSVSQVDRVKGDSIVTEKQADNLESDTADTTPMLAVMEIPELGGEGGSQFGLSWTGELPVEVEILQAGKLGKLKPVASPITLTERMSLVPDPRPSTSQQLTWRVLGSDGIAIYQTKSGSATYSWQPDFYGPGLDGAVLAATIYNDELVVAGRFRTAGKHVVNNIARWDGVRWAGFDGITGTGVTDESMPSGTVVFALAVFDGDLYVGGNFAIAGGNTVNNIARWTGSRWRGLDGSFGSIGVTGSVRALSVYGGQLVVGGANILRRWNGSSWGYFSPYPHPDGTVHTIQEYSGELVIGGDFDFMDDKLSNTANIEVNNIARWTGSEWLPLNGRFGLGTNGPVYALSVYESNLIVGGQFSSAASRADTGTIARWDGGDWFPIGDGSEQSIAGRVSSLIVDGNALFVGGFLGLDGASPGEPENNIYRWDGIAFDSIGSGLAGSVSSLGLYGGALVAGGSFSASNDATELNNIGQWDGSFWRTLESRTGNGLNQARAVARYDSQLVVGGAGVKALTGSQWSSLSGQGGTGPDGTVEAITVYNGELIAAGNFIEADGLTVNRIARWNGTRWAALTGPFGTGTDGTVLALAEYNGELIVGGQFASAGGVTVNHIARWNGSRWEDLSGSSGIGVDANVESLAVFDGELIVGGQFTTAAGITVNHVARWDGNRWAELRGASGFGVDTGSFNSVQDLVLYNSELIVAGRFTSAGGVPANNIARWDGSRWAELKGSSGVGLNGGAQALAVFGDNLVAGGNFTSAGGITVNHIARWDGADWTVLPRETELGLNNGSGFVNVFDLSVIDSDLFAAGNFVSAGNFASWSLGRYVMPYSISGTVNGLAGDGLVLQNNGADSLLINSNGSFEFPEPVGNGNGYNVSVNTQPADLSQTCTVTNGSGTVTGEDVTNVTVSCTTDTFTVGGTVSGLEGSGLVLQNHGGDDLAISSDGGFTFPTALVDGSGYAVTVATQPDSPSQTCSVSNASGTLNGADVTNVGVSCATDTFTVSGSVTGLSGNGLLLQNNGGDDLAISSDGGFTFPTALVDGSGYAVTVATQPSSPSQTCSVSDASGTLNGSDVTNVAVSCTTDTFTVGGSVTGLSGSGLVLQNNGGDDLVISSDGSFTFPTALVDGSGYAVTVATQPDSPSQTCSVSDGSGALDGVDVNGVTVTCTTDTFTVGGSVTGLSGNGLLLQNNGGDDLAITSDGGFAFPTSLVDGSGYAVTVATQPGSPSQTCSVSNASGTLNGSDVTNVAVSCTTDTFTVGGTVSGLEGSGLVLQNNGGDDLAISSDGGFTFPTALVDGNGYAVTVATQPDSPSQTCSVSNASGTLNGADVTNVGVSCATDTFTVSGSVTGLSGNGLLLQNNGGDDLAISSDGGFTFPTALVDGSGYAVTVATQPSSPSQTCSVSDASGTLNGSDVTNVAVSCTTDTFTVGGSVTGLSGSGLVLQNNGGDDLVISSDGSFTFPTALVDGSGYAVTVATQPDSPSQTCSVSDGSGALDGVDVNGVTVTCTTDTFTVGGSVTGLSGNGLLLQNNGGDDLAITSDGGFAFPTSLVDGSGYAVTVATQPGSPSQTCSVSNASGTLNGSDVTNVAVSCTTDTFTVGGTVSGLEGSGLVLQNNGGDDLAISSGGSFTFPAALIDGNGYAVTVATQPDSPSQTCLVSNGTGTLNGAGVTDVAVSCTTDTFSIGGSVSGLEGSGLVLQNNGGDDLAISSDGNFTFPTDLVDGSGYSVTAATQPDSPSQTCSVTNASGTLNGADVTNVAVSCTTDRFTVGGTVSGLSGSGLVLQNNGGDDLAIGSDGTFTFPTALVDGSDYAVKVVSQPVSPTQVCTVINADGVVENENITDVAISCLTVAIDPNPDRIEFQSVALGQVSQPRMVLLENTGSLPVQIGNVSIIGEGSEDFEIVGEDCSDRELAVSDFCGVDIVLAPSRPGKRTSTLLITLTAIEGDLEVGLVGASSIIFMNRFEPVVPVR